MIIYYNPGCSKCREALGLLEKNNCAVEIRDYLKIPPTVKELKVLVKKLGCRPIDLVRQGEVLFKENFSDKLYTAAQWLKILSMHPQLIERPILINENEAVIGRPPTLVLSLVKNEK